MRTSLCLSLPLSLLLSLAPPLQAQELLPPACLHGCTAPAGASNQCVAADGHARADTDLWLLVGALALCTAGRLAARR